MKHSAPKKLFYSFVKAICFYAGWLLLAYLTEIRMPSGPCTPGGGILLVLLLLPTSLSLMLFNFFKCVKFKSNGGALVVHLIVSSVLLYRFFS